MLISMLHEWNWTLLLGIAHAPFIGGNFTSNALISSNRCHCNIFFLHFSMSRLFYKLHHLSPLARLYSSNNLLSEGAQPNLTEGEGVVNFTITQTGTVGQAGCIEVATENSVGLIINFHLSILCIHII